MKVFYWERKVLQFLAISLLWTALFAQLNPKEMQATTNATTSLATTEMAIESDTVESFVIPTLDPLATCNDIRDKFGEANANISSCVVKYSHPIKVCVKCRRNYTTLQHYYHQILHESRNGIKCSEVLVDQDRLQVIRTQYIYKQQMWEQAHCEKCFEGNTTNITEDAQRIFELDNNISRCLYRYSKGDEIWTEKDIEDGKKPVCRICLKKYTQLNEAYEKFLSEKNKKKRNEACYDLIDRVNVTRKRWVEFECYKKGKHNEFVFMFCMASVFAIAILFIICSKFCLNEQKKDDESVPGPIHIENVDILHMLHGSPSEYRNFTWGAKCPGRRFPKTKY